MRRQSVFYVLALGIALIALATWMRRLQRRRDEESFLAQPRQLLRTFNAPLKWYSVFKITRISPRDPGTTYESNQLIIRTPGASAGRSNVYSFSFTGETTEDPRNVTISQVSPSTSKRKVLQDGDEFEPVQARLPVSVRLRRSSLAARAARSAYIQIQSDPDARGLYECLLQSYDPSMKFEAIQPKNPAALE